MSHIPSAAMPHAKPHEHEPTIAPPVRRDPLPWAALAAGGMLAIGGAITAAWLLRSGKGKQPTRKAAGRRSSAKSTRAKGRTGKPAKAKTGGAGDR